MKKVYIVIISFSICMTICGQTINQSNNCYRGSDVLEKKQIVVKGLSLNDTKGVWSLEEAELSEDTYNAHKVSDTLCLVKKYL